MKKILALLLTLVFALSLTACRKSNTSSDNSNVSAVLKQDESSETEIPAEQPGVISTESKAEAASSGTTPDKISSASKPNSKQNASSQPKPSTPSQNPDNNKPTQPTQPTTPTKLNPKTNFKCGRYDGKYFDNNNQVYYKISLDIQEDYQYGEYYVTCYIFGFATKEICEQNDWLYDDEYIENGITYYHTYSLEKIINGIVEMTDTLIKVGDQEGKWNNFSLNTDGTLVLETNGGVTNAKVGTVFTASQYWN